MFMVQKTQYCLFPKLTFRAMLSHIPHSKFLFWQGRGWGWGRGRGRRRIVKLLLNLYGNARIPQMGNSPCSLPTTMTRMSLTVEALSAQVSGKTPCVAEPDLIQHTAANHGLVESLALELWSNGWRTAFSLFAGSGEFKQTPWEIIEKQLVLLDTLK